ncbi:MAG: DUF2029 domain-containing protein [Chloroflexi bacterium]|nr:DUF2029 domain-containing protein [Chloroflexota bacterium]
MASSTTDRSKLRLLALVGLLFILAIGFLLSRSEPIRLRADFTQLWFAGRNLLTEGRNLYSTENGSDLIRFTGIETNPYEGNFYYPAHLFVLYYPLALLPLQSAHFIWLLFIQICFFVGLWLVIRSAGWPPSTNQITLFLILATLFIPTIQNTLFGQVNTIAVLGISLVYLALRRGNFAWAGVWASALTYKPQATLLPLLFLLVWAVLDRRRWRFLLGFGLAALTHWSLAEFFQPGWVPAFITSLTNYRFIPFALKSPLDSLWNPYQVFSISLSLAFAVLVFRHRRTQAAEPTFNLLLAISFALGWLAVPVVGMSNMVTAPAALIFLFAALKPEHSSLYRNGLIVISAIYILGIALFVFGLSTQYGLHIDLAEAVYKTGLSLAILTLALLQILDRHATAQA